MEGTWTCFNTKWYWRFFAF